MNIYNKLVRDKIPDIIKKSGNYCEIKILNDNEYLEKLNLKLKEECNEYLEDNNIEELADILEVIYAIAETKNISKEKLENIRKTKCIERGAFKNKLMLICTKDNEE